MANVVSTTIDMECGSCIIVSTFLPPLASLPPRRRVDLSHEGRGGPFILQKQPYGRMPPSPLREKVPKGRKRASGVAIHGHWFSDNDRCRMRMRPHLFTAAESARPLPPRRRVDLSRKGRGGSHGSILGQCSKYLFKNKVRPQQHIVVPET